MRQSSGVILVGREKQNVDTERQEKIETVFKLEPLYSIMNFKVGDTVQYTIWDGEEGRSYGWFWNTKTAKIVSVIYKMDNGDTIGESKLTLVAPKEPQKEEPPQSKSDPTKSS